MSTAADKTEKPKVCSVAPFGIEADHPRNGNLLVQSIPGCLLRGALKAGRTVKDNNGEELIPPDQARHLGQLPPVPGMQLHVNPKDGTYMIYDPLHENEELATLLKRRMDKAGPFRTSDKLSGVPKQKGQLDPDRMKTLVREMLNFVEAKEAVLVKGVLPSREDIEMLPGDFLLNPGLRSSSTQPRYEKDMDSFVRQVDFIR